MSRWQEPSATCCSVSFKKSSETSTPSRAQVFLIEQTPAVLGAFSPASQTYAATALKQHGVQLRLGTAVKEVTPNEVLLSDGSRLPTKMVIWAAGIKATVIPTQPAAKRQRDGRLEVQPDLSLTGFDEVYVPATSPTPWALTANPCPSSQPSPSKPEDTAQETSSPPSAANPTSPFVYSDRGILAMIGRNSAIAELGKHHHELVGAVAFAAWLGIHVALLTVVRAKLEAIVEWSWQYFTGEHAGQLIDR